MSENINDLTRLEQIKKRIAELNQKEVEYAEKNTRWFNQKLKNIQEEIKLQTENLKIEETRRELAKEFRKEQDSFAKSFSRLNSDTRKVLTDNNKQYSSFLALTKTVNAIKADINVKTKEHGSLELQINNSSDEHNDSLDRILEKSANEIEQVEYKKSLLDDIASSIVDEAKSLARTEATIRGITDFDEKRALIQENKIKLSEEEKKLALDNINLLEQITLKNARIQEIQEEQKSLYNALPTPIKEGVEFSKKLASSLKSGAIPMVLLASLALAALSSFTKLDEAAREFRDTTGLTNSQMKGIKADVNVIVGEFAGLGVEAKDVFNTISALKTEFSDITNFSREVVGALTVLNKNFGVSAEAAAKTQAIFENIGGLSSETAASIQLQVANMANLAGVAPAKVMADIAESAEIASTFFKGDINALAKAAVEARRLGTNIQRTADIAKGLLDFESSITSELEASAMLGQSINFNKARSLAFDGDTIGAQQEILKQIESVGDFTKLNIFEQEALAKASGLTVEEITKGIGMRKQLSNLTEAERKAAEAALELGIDISGKTKEQLDTEVKKLSLQQEQQATLEQLQNQFMAIASIVGSSLVPLLTSMGAILQPIGWLVSNIFEALNAIPGILPAIIAGFSTLYLISKKAAIQARIKAISEIFASGARMGPVGLIGAAAVTGGLLSLLAKPMAEPVGDVFSPADGKTRVSTKEGGLFELSPNDDLIAAPGLLSTVSSNNQSTEPMVMGMNTDELLNEIRGLRKDLNDGKVAVYMDGRKVTASVSRVVDRIGTNMYG
jgi:hypothetical protein